MVLNQLEEKRILPIVTMHSASDALALGDALLAGGLPLLEVAFRTKAAAEVLEILTAERPQLLLGAGTILTTAQADLAIAKGAKFIVSPGFNPKVVEHCLERSMPVFPGVNSPTQVEMGLERGLSVLKFFPAEVSGGIEMLKAMGAVYPVRFLCMGGIHEHNLKRYLDCDPVITCGSSWIVKEDLIAAGRFDEITERTRRVVAIGCRATSSPRRAVSS